MPDRYDPKFSVRPPGDRKHMEPSDDTDPLAELARIVSGRPTHEPQAGGRGKAPAGSAAPEPDVEQDLEAELLSDLQASFAAIREPLESASAAAAPDEEAAPELPAVEPAPARTAATHGPAEPVPQSPPRRAEPRTFDISHAFTESEFAPAKAARPEAPPHHEPVADRTAPVRQDPPIDTEVVAKSYVNPLRGPAALPKGDLPRRLAPPPRPTPPVRADQGSAVSRTGAPPPPRAERPVPPAPTKAPPGRRAPPPRGDYAHIPVRPLAGDEPRIAEPAQTATSRAGRSEAPPLASRFAPPRPPAAVAPPPRRPAAIEPPAELPPDDDFDLSDLAGEMEGPFEDEFVLDDLDGAYADDEFPPFPEDELASLKRRRTSRVFAVIAAMLAVVAIGGAAVFLYRSDVVNGGPPPIISADAGPTKVPPDGGPAAEGDAPSKLIYDRVGDSDDGTDTRLVTSGDAEIGTIPADDADVANNPISRVIIPGGPGIDRPVADGAAMADGSAPDAASTDDQSDIGPRMVRTVVVKPDGTIVSSEASGVDESGNALPTPAEEGVDMASTEIPPPQRSEMDTVLEGGDLPVNPDPLSNPSEPATAVVAEAEPIPEPPAEPAQITEFQPVADPPQAPEPAAATPTPAPAADPPPQRTAARQPANGPIDLTPGTAPAQGGGVLVQVTAQRSEEAAASAYRSLQQRYPNILGSFQARVVRADLGEKGVYYRVRIGPFSDADATRLCGDLKAAGAECMLAR